ncbi:hypothetical protein KB559_13765 [Paenibacillus sp. Marseille-P2973]|uniref:hypothetical protein n=1 Tax=Paenibacillus sp. Marseille-P2973 TaxID=1871032 RepID=UPI001B3772F2|nr:hypothetical protein [Paenibacillus sp. Marseille-P2973]MBQ4899913.1 hypothetical protein [Paenibacillus sp. Marseille-P2973]
MKRIIVCACLIAVFLMISGCGIGKQNEVPPVSEVSNVDQSPPNYAGLTIVNDGVEWDPGLESSKSFDETLLEMPFEVRIPEVPFLITHQAAEVVPASFQILRLTFANVDQGEQLMLSITNSTDKSKPEGKKGPPLDNGTPTWIQSNPNFSGLYWREDGLTYALASSKVEDHDFYPLYDVSELVQIANSLKR